MTILITIAAVLLILAGGVFGLMGLIASAMNEEVSVKIGFFDFIPAILALSAGIGLLWYF